MTEGPESQFQYDLCSLDELKRKGAMRFEFTGARTGRHEIGVFWDGERVAALDNYCPHQGGMLSHGVITRGQVVCPLHLAVFDLLTGECLDRYTDDTTAYEAQVRDGRVWVTAPRERPFIRGQ